MENAVKNGAVKKKERIPRNERLWLWIAVGAAVIVLCVGLGSMLLTATDFHTRAFEHKFKNHGSVARILLFFIFAYYVLKKVMQSGIANRWSEVKKGLAFLLKITRKWHAPVAVLTLAILILHGAGAILYGLKLDFSNITGLLAFLVLLPVPISGLLRYKRLDRSWHLRLGLAFGVLFIIHAFI